MVYGCCCCCRSCRRTVRKHSLTGANSAAHIWYVVPEFAWWSIVDVVATRCCCCCAIITHLAYVSISSRHVRCISLYIDVKRFGLCFPDKDVSLGSFVRRLSLSLLLAVVPLVPNDRCRNDAVAIPMKGAVVSMIVPAFDTTLDGCAKPKVNFRSFMLVVTILCDDSTTGSTKYNTSDKILVLKWCWVLFCALCKTTAIA